MSEVLPPVVATLEAQIASFEAAFTKANELLTKFATVVQRVTDRVPGMTGAIDDLDVMVKVLDERLTAATDHFVALNDVMGKTRAEAVSTAAALDKAAAAGGVGVAGARSASAIGAEAEAATTRVERLKSSLAGMAGAGQLVGLAVGFIGYESVKMAMTFDASMERIHTQAGVAQNQIAGLSRGVLDLAGKVGFSPDSLSEALFHIESNFASLGIKGVDALNMLKISAEGAAVGHANLVDVTNALTAAVAAGFPEVRNLSEAMGILNATVGSGDMQMQDLANAFSTGLLTSVRGFGLSLTDVGAALAVFGDNNMRGQVAATNLRMAVQALAHPAASAGAELAKLGLTSKTLALDMEHGGLKQAMTDLVDHMKKAGVTAAEQGQVIVDLFGKRAGTGINTLVLEYDRLLSKYPEITKASHSFAEAWAATQDTFAQKWNDLKGTFDSLAIRIGNGVLPVLTRLMGALQDGIVWVTGNQTALAALAGALGGLLVGALAAATIAFVEFMGAAGGIAIGLGAAVGVLVRFASSLSGVAHWAQSNGELLALVAAVLAVHLLPSIVDVTLMWEKFKTAVITSKALDLILTGSEGAAGAVRALGAAIFSTTTIATAGFAAAALGVYNVWQSFSGSGGQDAADKILAGFDPNKIDEATGKIQQMADATHQAQQALAAHVSNTGFVQDWWNLVHGSADNTNTMTSNVAKMKGALDQARVSMDAVHENLVMVSMATGVSTTALQGFATAAGVDLSKAVNQSGGDRQKLITYMNDLALKTGWTATTLNAAAGEGIDAWKQFTDAIDKAQQAAGAAFAKATDVIGSFAPANGTLKAQYAEAIKLGDQFVTDINAAIKRGLDPGIIAQLLAEGPKQAEPYLKAVLAGHSNTMIQMANKAEAALASISASVVEQARLTQIAVSSQNAQTSLDFAKASAISSAFILSNGTATVQGIAKSLHMSAGEVQRIAGEFGIHLLSAVQAAADAHPITVYGTAVVTTQYQAARQSVYASQVPSKARASGGPVQAFASYLVGENGPEVFSPDMSGHITPGRAAAPSGSGGGGDGMALITVNVDVGGRHLYTEVQQQSLRRDRRNRPGAPGLSY